MIMVLPASIPAIDPSPGLPIAYSELEIENIAGVRQCPNTRSSGGSFLSVTTPTMAQ